jgi:hypothetical protein
MHEVVAAVEAMKDEAGEVRAGSSPGRSPFLDSDGAQDMASGIHRQEERVQRRERVPPSLCCAGEVLLAGLSLRAPSLHPRCSVVQVGRRACTAACSPSSRTCSGW